MYKLIMPSIGEGITHVKVKKWLKEVGEKVKKDENILEVFSDKVDIVVQASSSGVLKQRLVEEDSELGVGDPYGVLASSEGLSNQSGDEGISSRQGGANDSASSYQGERTPTTFPSPLIRSICKAENISERELESIRGSGKDGRVTKQDILDYIKTKKEAEKLEAPDFSAQQVRTAPLETTVSNKVEARVESSQKAPLADDTDKVIPMDNIRRVIAANMVKSKQVAPHVSSVIEADVTDIVRWKKENESTFLNANGIKLTYTPMFIEAAAKAIKAYPLINSSVKDNDIIMHKNINIGLATALSDGNLIVPVIKQADQKNLVGLAMALQELATKARANKLRPEDISQGTFTITNMAPFNNIMAFPIIKQPEVAILAIGKIVKKPVATKDNAIALRDTVYLTLTYDHRIIDGAVGGKFLSHIGALLESFNKN